MGSSTDTEAFEALADVARSLRVVRRDLTHAGATLRRARQEVRAITAWSRDLPRLTVDPSHDRHGDEVLRGLSSHQPWPFRFRAVAVITLPDTFAEYLRGRSKQAVRTNRRHAQALGFGVVRACSPEHARELLTVMLEHHTFAPSVDQLLSYHLERGVAQLWFATAGRTPFAMAAVAVDNGVAQLGTLQVALDAPDRSAARYLLSTEIVASLIDHGVGHLLADSMLLSSPGVVYLQQRLGFQPTTVDVPRRRRRHGGFDDEPRASRTGERAPLRSVDRVLDLAQL